MEDIKEVVIILLVAILFVVTCKVPQYSRKYFQVVDIIDDSTYMAKIQVGEWVQSYKVVQSYEEWEVGDTIYFTNKKPE